MNKNRVGLPFGGCRRLWCTCPKSGLLEFLLPSKNKEKIVERWVKLFNIDPNKNFLDTELLYVNYYAYLINEIRDNITRYVKSKPFDRIHVMAIQAHEFARKLIVSYYEKLISSTNKEDKSITFGEEVELKIKSRKI